MRFFFLCCVLVLSTPIIGQQKTFVGMNLSSFVFQTLDVQYERNINTNLAIQIGLGGRFQKRDMESPLRFAALEGYVQPKNHALSLSVAGRFSNLHEHELDYPYIAVGFNLSYFNETIETNINQVPGTQDVSGVKLGGFLTVGYSISLADRIALDLGLQIGYAKARKDVLAYYLPGMGFTTFGLSYIGIEGGHINPVVVFKYKLVKDKRERIREM